ncbi:MAG: SOS response-associated peptidase [Gemmatimonadaceae bacterium]|nr:SOS response-associated peptidase [Gemmatimonadaceae bacterium]
MCGRATVTNPEGIEEKVYGFSTRFVPTEWRPRYNLNPREDIPVVHVDDSGERSLRLMHWNFVPGHLASREQVMSFDSQYSTFNAKIERAAIAPTFRSAWRKQRCLVVVDGIFEWVGAKGVKTPHLVRRRDRATFAMAGLWSVWRGHDGEELWSCAIMVGPSAEWYLPFHHRMAAILPPASYDAWLDPALTDAAAVEETLKAAPYSHSEHLESVIVSKRINNPRYDAPDCLVPDAAA